MHLQYTRTFIILESCWFFMYVIQGIQVAHLCVFYFLSSSFSNWNYVRLLLVCVCVGGGGGAPFIQVDSLSSLHYWVL